MPARAIKKCVIQGCKYGHSARGMCYNHYQRGRKRAIEAGFNMRRVTTASVQALACIKKVYMEKYEP